jgi:hypothetical protein
MSERKDSSKGDDYKSSQISALRGNQSLELVEPVLHDDEGRRGRRIAPASRRF